MALEYSERRFYRFIIKTKIDRKYKFSLQTSKITINKKRCSQAAEVYGEMA
jgi:hypothetical protein